MTQHTNMLKHCLLKEQHLSFQCCVAVQQRLTDHELCDNSGNQDELISIFPDYEQSWLNPCCCAVYQGISAQKTSVWESALYKSVLSPMVKLFCSA